MDHTVRMYEINEVAQLTGLAPARLRAWERRYEVVRPQRLANGYRAYTGEQVALLRGFARLVAAGERIGDLASEPPREVLARAARRESRATPLGELLGAIQSLDREQFEELLAKEISLRGLRGLVQEITIPLAYSIGDLWATGQLPIAAEHLASEVIVQVLKSGLRPHRSTAPTVVAATVVGERHEWGMLGALVMLQDQGWRVQYLGPELPVDELVEAAWHTGAAAAAFSCSAPARLDSLLPALLTLPEKLPPETKALIGGAAVATHACALRNAGYLMEADAYSVRRDGRARA